MQSLLAEKKALIDFASSYQGKKWKITSIKAYHYTRTNECIYLVYMFRLDWSFERGCEDQRIIITRNSNGFQAEPVEVQSWLPRSKFP